MGRHKTNAKWFEGLTVEHESYFKELLSALNQKAKNELLKKLRELLSTSPLYEVEFSNPTIALVARRIVEAFSQEWYHVVPLVFIESDRRTVRVEWKESKS